MSIGALGYFNDFFLSSVWFAVGDVFADCSGKQEGLLKDHTHRRAQARCGQVLGIMPEYLEAAMAGLIKP